MEKERFFSKKTLFFMFVSLAVVFCSLFTIKPANVYAENVNFSNSIQNSVYSSNTLTNNIVFIKFKGEEETYSLYGNSFDLFNEMFNDGEFSVENYYKANSNGKFDLKSDIISSDQKNIKIYTVDKPRSYYIPYMYYNNQTKQYTVNPNGYFEYYVVDGTSPVDSGNILNILTMYTSRTMISRVYKLDGSPTDSDNSDKIMSYDAAVTYAKNNSCTVAESYERYLREYELICNVMELAKDDMDTTNSDKNGDKIIDCFSLALIDNYEASQYRIEWSTLLWAHQGNLGSIGSYKIYISMFQTKLKTSLKNYGMNESDIDIWLNYINNQPKTSNGLTFGNIYLSNYEMFNLTTKSEWDSEILDNTTACHELGHVLGLPDLYSYADNSSDAVGSWSHMCQSHQKYASFFTSYEREKFNWLDNSNIQTLEYAGEYTLNVVKGYDNTNVVAYKINIPDTNEWIYFEYRNPNSNKEGFDTRCGNQSGLLVYTVNTSIDGNSQCPPYEIYIQRQSSKSVWYATLKQGQSLGNSNKNITTNAICYNMQSKQNTGLVINVTNIDTDLGILTFEISGDILKTNDYPTYTAKDFNNNNDLYNKLLSQSVTPGVLNEKSFVGNTLLDLSSCNLTSLFDFNMFDLSTITYVDLSNNLLDNSIQNSITDIMQTIPTVTKVYLAFNSFDLSVISSYILNINTLEWGVQLVNRETQFLNNPPDFKYFYTSNSDIESISLNGTVLELCPSTVKVYTVQNYGDCTLTLKYKDSSPLNTKTYSHNFKNYKIESKYTENNRLKLSMKDNFPNFKSLINTYGFTDLSGITMTGDYPLLDTVGDFDFVLMLDCGKMGSLNLLVYYQVTDLDVIYLTEETVYEIGETYTEKYIDVYENGVKMNYTLSQSGDPLTYYVTYYYGTVNEDGSLNVTTVAPELTTGIQRNYVVSYTVTSSFGKKYQFNRQIVVSNDVIKPTSVDSKIYARLLEISGRTNYLYKSDFIKNNYIDLSSINPDSLKGVELLETGSDVVVDLSNNNLSDIDAINNILSTNTSVKLILLLNNFNLSQLGNINSISRCIFGIQNLKQKTITNEEIICIGDVYTDFDNNFNLSMQGLNIENGKLMLSTKGLNQECVITSNIELANNKEYTVYISYGYINLSNKKLTKEYSDEVIIYADEFFVTDGLTSDEQKIVEEKYDNKNIRTLFDELNRLGIFNVDFTFEFENQIITLTLEFTNQDTRKPVIDFKGKKEVYITSKEQYDELYKDDICSIIDGYDGELTPQISDLILSEFGTYEVKYTASDSSNNSCEYIRIVHYGKVDLTNNQSSEQYNSKFVIPFVYYEFSEDDFKITYKINDSTNNYSGKTGILLNSFGEYEINFEFVHKQNEDIKYNFKYKVNITDQVKPKITLKGESKYEFYAGGNYVEQGYVITDNSTDDILTETTKSNDITLVIKIYFKINGSTIYNEVDRVDTSKIGTYKITYIATDKFNNVSDLDRYVDIVYAPIDNLVIDETKLLTQYSQDKTIEFDIFTDSEYLTTPNPQVTWFVNGNVVGTSNGKFKYKFKDAGDYEIYAVLNDNTKVTTQTITLHVYEKSPYEGVVLWIGVGLGAIALAGFCAFLVGVYKKRNFY